MRFDEYVKRCGSMVSPVDQFDGFVVEVGVPPGWEPFDSAVGVRVWVCRKDPCINEFCANAVLTMHGVDTVLDVDEVFEMLVEQQTQSVLGCRELHGELTTATEGAGVVGALGMKIAGDRGTIDSQVQSRIIATEKQTWIAQLTVTALQDSPANRDDVWLTVRAGAVGVSASAGHHRVVPVVTSRDARR